jgi:HD-like signal output (HDOD) protein
MAKSAYLLKSDERFPQVEWLQCSSLRLRDLPSLPVVALKLMEKVQDPKASAQELAELINRDPSTSAKVLRLANSSYYGIPGGATNIQKALVYLGLQTLSQLVLGLSVVGAFQGFDQLNQFPIKTYWRHSLATATLAAENAPQGETGNAFTLGLLHDLGWLALAVVDPELWGSLSEGAKQAGVSFSQYEMKTLGFHAHAELGQRLALQWNLPASIQEVCKSHHHDGTRILHLTGGDSELPVHQVRLADQLASTLGFGFSGGAVPGARPNQQASSQFSKEKAEQLSREVDKMEAALYA